MCLYTHYKKKEKEMEVDNKLQTVKLYKDTLTLYKKYIVDSSNENYDNLRHKLNAVAMFKEELEEVKDEEALTLLHMWYIDGEGWLNLVPVDEQVEQALEACQRALNRPIDNTDEFMNLDIQYINPNMTQIDKDNVDEFVGAVKEAKENIEEEIKKIEEDDTMKNEETKTEEVKETSKVKKYAKWAFGGAAIIGVAVAAKYAYDHFVEDGVIVLDFGK